MEKGVTARGSNFDRIVSLVQTLRGQNGCPWDREQTPETMKVYLLEEAHELLEALESGTPEDVCGELGDLLFHIVFLTRIFQERGDFNMGDVIQRISEKMIRRHPHVFGEAHVSTSEEVRDMWHEIKMAEGRKQNGFHRSGLDSVPKKLPALMRAYRLGERAAKVGIDRPDVETILLRLEGSLARLRAALGKDEVEETTEALGNLLFDGANLGRFIRVHPETALTRTISRFVRSFGPAEDTLKQESVAPGSVSPEETAASQARRKKKAEI